VQVRRAIDSFRELDHHPEDQGRRSGHTGALRSYRIEIALRRRSIQSVLFALTAAAMMSVSLGVVTPGVAQARSGAEWPDQQVVSSDQAQVFVELRARHSDKCLDVDGRGPGGAGADFANVMQYHCWGGTNQHWRIVHIP
jgi:hypothetical protein